MAHDNCWQCGHPSAKSLFCRFCNSLQRPVPDYFAFFDMERRLSLDREELERRFYSLSRLLHPDLYHSRTPTERQFSLEATAILNDAYRTLRDPVSRAEYILKERGFDIGEQRGNDVPPALLEEVFELNMALEELREGDTSARPQLEQARRRFKEMRDEVDGELDNLFREYDSTQQPALLAEVRRLLNRRNYIRNLVSEVEKELAA